MINLLLRPNSTKTGDKDVDWPLVNIELPEKQIFEKKAGWRYGDEYGPYFD